MGEICGTVVLVAILAGTWAVWGPKVMLGVIATPFVLLAVLGVVVVVKELRPRQVSIQYDDTLPPGATLLPRR
jgi:hypothetical protein